MGLRKDQNRGLVERDEASEGAKLRLGLNAGSMLDFQVLPDNTITARAVKPDARRIRGLLKSPHAHPLTVEQMDEGIAKHLRDKHAPIARRGKPSGR